MDQFVKSSHSLVEAVKENATILFEDSKKFDEVFDALCAELRQRHADIGTDVSTKSKRDEIISAAYDVTLIKGRIEKAGKARNDPLNAEIKSNNRMRKRSETELEAISKELRQPVTNWEKQEKARQESHEAVIAGIKCELQVGPRETSADIAARLDAVRKTDTSHGALQEYSPEAKAAQKEADAFLSAALDKAREAEEAERELAELKARVAKQDEENRKAKEAQEAAERKAEEERREKERKAEIARQAEEREAELNRLAAAAAQKAAEEARKQAEVEAAEKERRRLAAEKADRDERERRARDEENRARIITAISSSIEALAGIERYQAEAIAAAIAAGEVPHVRVDF